MVADANDNRRPKRTLQKLARTLLATTCLTAVSSGIAVGSVVNEGTSPAPADFPNTANGFVLPVGTTQVNGAINFLSDPADWFEFTGLLPLSSFSLSASAPVTGYSDSVTLQNTGLGNIAGPMVFDQGVPAFLGPLTVPSDGKIVVGITVNESGGNYSIFLNASLAPSSGTPEPSTLPAVGMGMALAALAWRRKRSQ
jgi:hypothetical protein